jgi:hypothetical protein
VPINSIVSRKRVVSIAIFRAKVRYTVEGAVPIRLRNTSALPSGFINGSRALKESPKNLLKSSTAQQDSSSHAREDELGT